MDYFIPIINTMLIILHFVVIVAVIVYISKSKKHKDIVEDSLHEIQKDIADMKKTGGE